MDARLEILGPVGVRAGDRFVPIERPMVRGLLATLVLRKNTVVPREALALALWDRPPESAEVNLRQYVMDLRRQLSHVDDGLAERLRTVREVGYELVLGDRESDYDEFNETWRDARTFLLAGVFRIAAGWLWLAVNEWRGAAGADTPTGGRLERGLSALQEERLAAEEDLAAAQIALGEGPVVVGTLCSRNTLDGRGQHSCSCWPNTVQGASLVLSTHIPTSGRR